MKQPNAFDYWRSHYAETTYADQVAFHEQVWKTFPVQTQVDLAAACEFFNAIHEPVRQVLELGGWTGVAAAAVLPHLPDLERWLNVELCRSAAEKRATDDPAYEAVVLDDWLWNQPDGFFAPFTVFFASHSIEHLAGANVEALLPKLANVRYVYLDAPLSQDAPDWFGYPGCHVLEWGWSRLLEEFARHGWRPFHDGCNEQECSTIYMLRRE